MKPENNKIKNTAEKTAKNNQPIQYYPDAQFKCSCGATYTVGSTIAGGNVEICSACHPFYTGTQKFIDAAGRLEKFQAKLKASQELRKNKR